MVLIGLILSAAAIGRAGEIQGPWVGDSAWPKVLAEFRRMAAEQEGVEHLNEALALQP